MGHIFKLSGKAVAGKAAFRPSLGFVVLVAVFVAAIGMRSPGGLPKSVPSLPPVTLQRRAGLDKIDTLETAADAAKSQGDWAGAEADYRAEMQLSSCPSRSEREVLRGLMQEYQGKRAQAFESYRQGFGLGTPHRLNVQGRLELVEAAARCGLMCEECGRHTEACACYQTAQSVRTLEADKTTPAQVRTLLHRVLSNVQQEEERRGARHLPGGG